MTDSGTTGLRHSPALSPNLWSLIAFRCVQAAGGVILVPASLGLILVALPAVK